MKINYKKIFAFTVAFSFLAIPLFILHAQHGGTVTPTIKNPLGSTVNNPLGSSDINALLLKIMNLVATIGAIVVVFMIIFSGYTIVTAKGDTGALDKGKDMLKATIIGGAILLGADVIANVVVNTVNSTVGRS